MGSTLEKVFLWAVAVIALGGVLLWAGRSLQRARIGANEVATQQAVQAVLDAQSEYAELDRGRFGTLECLAEPRQCLPDFARDRPPLLSAELASLATRDGYLREFRLTSDREQFQYWALPEAGSGNRVFCADADAYKIYSLEDAAVTARTCDSLRAAFEGVQERARQRSDLRRRLRAGRQD